MRLAILIPVAMLASVAVPGFSQPAQAPTIAALQVIQPGQWALRSRSDPAQSRALCLGDPALLLQLRHARLPAPALLSRTIRAAQLCNIVAQAVAMGGRRSGLKRRA